MTDNRLAKETSAYLKGETRQPVDWYAWGEEYHQDYFARNPWGVLPVGRRPEGREVPEEVRLEAEEVNQKS